MSINRFPHSPKEERFEFEPELRAELGRIIEKYPVRRSALIPALKLAQRQNGSISSAVMQHLAEIFEISPMEVWGVVTFYTMLYLDPQPKRHLRVCRDLSCHLAGAQETVHAFERELGIRRGEPTADGEFNLEAVSCLGLCDLQPAMLVNLEPHGPVRADAVPGLLREIRTRDA